MIKDKIENAKIYYNLSDNIKNGLNWLEAIDLNKLEDGKYMIKDNDVYASIQTYTTKTDAYYESHRRYIDIQYLINGKEKIGVTDLSNCETCIEYDKERDLEFYNITTKEEFIELQEGSFAIFYPHDAHKPSIAIEKPNEVKKVVVKVAID